MGFSYGSHWLWREMKCTRLLGQRNNVDHVSLCHFEAKTITAFDSGKHAFHYFMLTHIQRLYETNICPQCYSPFSTKRKAPMLCYSLLTSLRCSWSRLVFNSLLPKYLRSDVLKTCGKYKKNDTRRLAYSVVWVCVCELLSHELRRALFMASVDLKGAAHFLIW